MTNQSDYIPIPGSPGDEDTIQDDTTLIDSDAEDDPLLEESGPPAHLYDRYDG